MNTLTAGRRIPRKQLMVVELVAKLVLAFAIGLATSIALAGVVLLLAHDARAAELEGGIEERQAARAPYQQAESSAHRAALVLALNGCERPARVRPKEDGLKPGAIPTDLSEGRKYGGQVFGEPPPGATGSLWNLLAGFLTLLLAIGGVLGARRSRRGGLERKAPTFSGPPASREDWPLGVECAWPAARLPALARPRRSGFSPTRRPAAGRPTLPRRWQCWLAAVAFGPGLWQLGQGSDLQAQAWLGLTPIGQTWVKGAIA